ncbi:MAG: enoyl-CoA hydratase/isomerase family protein [Leucobacter sp.]
MYQPSLDPADFEVLRVSESENRVHVVIDRPEARNAIDLRMVHELHALCTYLELMPKILIISGTQASDSNKSAVFASGADIKELRDRRRHEGLQGINAYLFQRIAQLPMPVIAVLDGYALGGGAELAFAADFRIGTPELRLGNPETGLGIMAAAGGTWRLPELIGEPLAKEVLLAGRVLNGAECLAAGAITQLVESSELGEAAEQLANRIATQDRTAVQVTKKVLRMPRAAHPDVDTIAQALLFESEQKFERMDAFLAKGRAKTAKV